MREAAGAFLLPLAVAVAFLLWLNARLYGSPLMSGYGAASGLFALGNVPINLGRYARWLVETQTPVVLLAVAAPFAAWRTRRTDPGAASPARSWLALGFVGVVMACYLPYSPFEEWWYLRFLLPAIPVLLILTTPLFVRLVSAAPGAVRAPLFVAGVGLLAAHYVALANERSAFDLRRLESRYVAAGAFASQQLPQNAVLLSVQESGPLRMYGGRTTVRFDYLDPQGLDAAVQFLDRAGYRPYFALEAWEETQFRERFARASPLGLLDWPPMAEVGRPVKVRFYDPRDRRRFLDGEPVPTARDRSTIAAAADDARIARCRSARAASLRRDQLLLVFRVGLQDELAHALLRRRVHHRPEQREAPPFAVHGVLPGRERDVAAVAVLPLPHPEPDELEAIERAFAEVQLGVGELAGRVAAIVLCELHHHDVLLEPRLCRARRIGVGRGRGPAWSVDPGADCGVL